MSYYTRNLWENILKTNKQKTYLFGAGMCVFFFFWGGGEEGEGGCFFQVLHCFHFRSE